MEKVQEYPMHTRITDKTYVPLWQDEEISGRLFWFVMIASSILMLLIFTVILIITVRENPNPVSEMLIIIALMICIIFLLGVMLRGRHIPEQYGKVVFGEDVYYELPFGQHAKSMKQRCSYDDIRFIHIGSCPELFCRWESYRLRWPSEADIKRMSRHYGDNYIVALNEKQRTLFGLTYNEGAWKLLLERCPSAEVFTSQKDYDDYRLEEKRRADAFEEEMKKKSGMQSFEGYIN